MLAWPACRPTAATLPNALCRRVAPEILLGKAHCTSAVDIYSFGVRGNWKNYGYRRKLLLPAAPRLLATCYCNCTSHPAPSHPSPQVLLWEIVTGGRVQRGNLRPPRVPEESPQEIADLIDQCLSEDPQARPTAQQLLQALSAHLPASRRHGMAGGGPGAGASAGAATASASG